MTNTVHYHLGDFPPDDIDWARLVPLIGDARTALLNYRHALSSAARALDEERPLSQHLLQEAHALLMQGVRGRDKDPGAFRNSQPAPGRRDWREPVEWRHEVLALLDSAENGLSRRDILLRLSPAVSERQVRRALEYLRDRGLVVSSGRGRSARWKPKTDG